MICSHQERNTKNKHLELETRVAHVLEVVRRLLEKKYSRARDRLPGFPKMFLPMVVLKKNPQLPCSPPSVTPATLPQRLYSTKKFSKSRFQYCRYWCRQVIHSTGLFDWRGWLALATQDLANPCNKGINIGRGGVPRRHPPHLVTINIPVPEE